MKLKEHHLIIMGNWYRPTHEIIEKLEKETGNPWLERRYSAQVWRLRKHGYGEFLPFKKVGQKKTNEIIGKPEEKKKYTAINILSMRW